MRKSLDQISPRVRMMSTHHPPHSTIKCGQCYVFSSNNFESPSSDRCGFHYIPKTKCLAALETVVAAPAAIAPMAAEGNLLSNFPLFYLHLIYSLLDRCLVNLICDRTIRAVAKCTRS